MRWLRNLWLGGVFVAREFGDDRGADRSAALAYGTLLSLVPLLATAAALFRAFFPFGPDQLIATATVILGRTAAYTGNMLNYSWVLKDSMLDLRPPKFEFGPLPVAPLAIPGRTELI